MNGHTEATYALPQSHREMMEKPLAELDPEVYETIVRVPPFQHLCSPY